MKRKLTLHKKITLFIISMFIMTSFLPYVSTGLKEYNIGELSEEKKSNQPEYNSEKYAMQSHYFTKNIGQFHEDVLYQTHVDDATIYFCKNKIITVYNLLIKDENEKQNYDVFSLNKPFLKKEDNNNIWTTSIVTKFNNANEEATINGQRRLQHYNNYFIGKNQEKWISNVPNYESVLYEDIYPDIDLMYYWAEGKLKYDFFVEPKADISMIEICYDGISNLEITSNGDIEILTSFGSIHEKKPVFFQEIDGCKKEILGNYEMRRSGIFGFSVNEEYDPKYPLIIDPELTYGTFIGGNGGDEGMDLVVDDQGDMYITGGTHSDNFPTENPYDGSYNGHFEAFVTKLSASGSELIYSTYIGGSDLDKAVGIVVDENGNAIIFGYTYSTDFPTENAYYDQHNGLRDIFISALSPEGNTLIFSSHLGGTNSCDSGDIAIDSEGNVYITGYTSSKDFPILHAYDDTLDGCTDAFITKLAPTVGGIDSLIYSTLLGGSWGEMGYGIAVDNNDCAYVTGSTGYSDFPTVNAYDETNNGGCEIFVSKLSPSGDSLLYSTYFGGSNNDMVASIDVDNQGDVYISGFTESDDFPIMNAYDASYNGYWDGFLSKFSPSIGGVDSLIYSTYLGGSASEIGMDVAVDSVGDVYMVGWTTSSDFPTVDPYDGSYSGQEDVVLSKLSLSLNGSDTLIYSTYIGTSLGEYPNSVIVDSICNIYITGITESSDFPLVDPYDDSFNGLSDIFILTFSFDNIPPYIEITKPVPSLIYLFDRFIFKRLFSDAPIIIGSVSIMVNATDDLSGMDRIELYIDDVLRGNMTDYPYSWTWTDKSFSQHDIKIIAYDKAQNSVIEEIHVSKFF